MTGSAGSEGFPRPLEAPISATTLRESLSDLAREAGTIARRHYGRVQVEVKDNETVITAADREVEAFLRDQLAQLLPQAAYIGEETTRDAATVQAARDREWVWVVDPIDGTAGFVDGLDLFCICIGLLHHGQPFAGALFFPVLEHLYTAVRGTGAEYDGRPIRTLTEEPIADRRILYVDAYAHRRFHITYPGKTRSLSTTALHYALAARGWPWGHCPTRMFGITPPPPRYWKRPAGCCGIWMVAPWTGGRPWRDTTFILPC